MAADRYGKGSIIYKLLIVILVAVLAVSIIYPKKLWDEEASRLELCRYRMSNLYNAELQYQRFHQGYTDTLDRLLAFVKHDPRYLHFVDSVVVQPIRRARLLLDTLRQIQQNVDILIPVGTEAMMKDSIAALEDRVAGRSRDIRQLMEDIRERMLTFPALPVVLYDKGLEIIERKDYFLKMEVVRRMVVETGELPVAQTASREAIANIDSISHHLQQTLTAFVEVPGKADSLVSCPTVFRSYQVALQDSGVFKFVNIYCPINDQDSVALSQDFMRSKVGAFKIRNHGHVERHRKSWETES